MNYIFVVRTLFPGTNTDTAHAAHTRKKHLTSYCLFFSLLPLEQEFIAKRILKVFSREDVESSSGSLGDENYSKVLCESDVTIIVVVEEGKL